MLYHHSDVEADHHEYEEIKTPVPSGDFKIFSIDLDLPSTSIAAGGSPLVVATPPDVKGKGGYTSTPFPCKSPSEKESGWLSSYVPPSTSVHQRRLQLEADRLASSKVRQNVASVEESAVVVGSVVDGGIVGVKVEETKVEVEGEVLSEVVVDGLKVVGDVLGVEVDDADAGVDDTVLAEDAEVSGCSAGGELTFREVESPAIIYQGDLPMSSAVGSPLPSTSAPASTPSPLASSSPEVADTGPLVRMNSLRTKGVHLNIVRAPSKEQLSAAAVPLTATAPVADAAEGAAGYKPLSDIRMAVGFFLLYLKFS